jgi:hypothetical protein
MLFAQLSLPVIRRLPRGSLWLRLWKGLHPALDNCSFIFVLL